MTVKNIKHKHISIKKQQIQQKQNKQHRSKGKYSHLHKKMSK